MTSKDCAEKIFYDNYVVYEGFRKSAFQKINDKLIDIGRNSPQYKVATSLNFLRHYLLYFHSFLSFEVHTEYRNKGTK